ncbi:MAG: hypothetical protein JNM00_04900 [Flavobacteriales bacterium]|nr:hypothetical protein [Flavobacteriales bacterium]
MKYTIAIVFALFTLSGCELEETCTPPECDHGSQDELNCACDCYENWSGIHCDQFNPLPHFTAQISPNGNPPYTFNANLDLHLIDSAVDTLWIDGYLDNGPGDADDQYVFMNLLVADIHNIAPGSEYEVFGSYEVDRVYASFHDPDVSPNIFFAPFVTSGTLTINEVWFDYDTAGNDFASGSFEMMLQDGMGNSVVIIGAFNGPAN